MTQSADPVQVGRARKGDAAAFEALVAPRVAPMSRTAMGILGHEDEALDATRDALVIAWRELVSLRDPAALDAWLARILVNRCRRGQRSVGRGRPDEPPSEPAIRAADVAGREGHLERAFDRLNVDERVILVLRHLDGLPSAAIAQVLRIAESKAEARLAEARTSLDRALAWEIRLVPPGPVGSAGSDDALEAMLRTRAGELDPGAAPVVLARVRDEMRAHRPGGLMGILPFGERAGSLSGRAGWGAAIAAAVLVTVVLGGRQIGSPAASPGVPVSEATTPAASPDGTAPPDPCSSASPTPSGGAPAGGAPSGGAQSAVGSSAGPTGTAMPASSCGPGG